MRTTIAVAVTAGTIVTGVTAYAVYFDHRRRTDPEFRKALRREHRKEERAARHRAEADGARQRMAIKAAVAQVKEEGFPADNDEKEIFFMQEIGRGEARCADGSADPLETALCFYRALKVYQAPRELISIYDKSVPKHILDILAEMIAMDKSIAVGPFGGSASMDGAGPGIE
ncbi:MAG: hypothetical protein M1826_005300 [Phylliscum demangeonii]|nr:MAG: hypothetical protein M1826_005300 [Phylliscum demangeonii]